jgi:Zn-finger nucleic acid-binding protein
MNCPKCKELTLAAATLDGVEVDTCSECKGVWFDKAELPELLGKKTQRVEPIMGGEDGADANYQRGVACPRDGQNLLRVRSNRNRDVTVDACVVCQGVWLDGGEFERIKRATPGIGLGDLI